MKVHKHWKDLALAVQLSGNNHGEWFLELVRLNARRDPRRGLENFILPQDGSPAFLLWQEQWEVWMKGKSNNWQDEVVLWKSWAEEKGWYFFAPWEEGYPDSFLEERDYPLLVWSTREKILINEMNIGVVGSRKASSYGLFACSMIVKDLVQSYGCTILSGCAQGIDMSAHRQVQASAGYTIGFIACGASLVSRWQREQFKNDCLLSIFPPNVRAQKWHFLQRNTYISRMGAGILVIEADLKSGTMITAHRALEQGKPLAVLTQPFASLRWAAVKELHDLGAQIIGSARDCVEIMLPEKLEAREKEKTTEVFLQAETDQEKEWISYLLERGGSIFEQDIKENLSLEASESLQNKGIITRQAGVVFLSCMIQS